MGRRRKSKDAPESGWTGKEEKRGRRERQGIGVGGGAGKDPSVFVVLVSPAGILFCRS